MSTKNGKPNILNLLMLVALASVSAVMYTPAIPAMKQFFGISGSAIQFTITIFLIGYTVGQLIYGPLAKAHGRKKTLYIGVAIAIIGSLLCAFSYYADSFGLLIFGRLVQSLGASAGLCVAFMIINEAFEGEESRKVSIMATLAFAILPSISIFIGGILTHYVNWDFIFYVLALYMLFVGLVSMTLPETGGNDHGYKIRIGVMVKDYLAVLKSVPFVVFSFAWGFATAAIYIYSATSPSIAINSLGMNPATYGSANLAVSAALLVGIFINLYLSKHLSGMKCCVIGAVISICSAIYLAYIYLHHLALPYDFFGTICFLYIGLALIFPNASSLAMGAVKDKASGSAMMSFLNMGTAVMLQWVVSLFATNIFQTVVVTFSGICVVFFVLLLLGYLSKR